MGQQLEALVEMEDLAIEEKAISTQNLPDDGDRFTHAQKWPIEGHAVPARHHLVATGPQAEDEAAAGDQVERGRGLRKQRGTTAEHVDDARAKVDALRAGGEGAKDGDGIGAIRFRHPERLVAEGFGALSE